MLIASQNVPNAEFVSAFFFSSTSACVCGGGVEGRVRVREVVEV